MRQSYDLAEMRRLFDRDGVILVPGLLANGDIEDALGAFEWSRTHPGPLFEAFPGDPACYQDRCNPAAYEAYRPMLDRSPLPALVAQLWGSDAVWFMFEQIFHKREGGGRTEWHQDTPFLPVDGPHLIVSWTSFEPQDRSQALEFCAGSHRGPLYNGVALEEDGTPIPFYDKGEFSPVPNIEAEREKWPIVGWATQPGDVILFHPSVLHGGGSPGPAAVRRTLSLRFFGDDAFYAPRPGDVAAPKIPGLDEMLRAGEPFRHPVFPELAI
jgi:hypothetical protein